jgi:hypothetical protein
MEDDRVEADSIEETEAKGEFVELPQDGATDFYDGEFGRLGRI